MKKFPIKSNIIVQIGLVVNDIEKTAQDYANFLGVDIPPITMTDTLEKANTQYKGKDTKARAKLAFFDVGNNLQLELIEPDLEPSTWRNDLDKNGEGFHHIAFYVKDMMKLISVLEQNEMELLQTGDYTGGRYAYIDANNSLKVVLELLENF